MTSLPLANTPIGVARRLAGRWDLTQDLIYRELVGRYRGSILGIFWSLIQPLFLLAIYTVVFGKIMPIRIKPEGVDGSIADFAIFLFCGMITWNLVSESIGSACNLVVNRPTFVKKVVFPLEILAVVQVGVALVHFFFAFVILFAAIAIFQELHLTTLWLPVIIAPLAILCLGLTWMLAALGVFLRDLGESIGIVLMAGMFVAPVFYPLDGNLPALFKALVLCNPATWFIVQMRHILTDGMSPPLLSLAFLWAVSLLIAWGGFLFFERARPGFGDVT
ncbi:MAG: ABC transporter permease [Planctomycetes bacterium]|nr:ABC transporter permease [Planctomycetota bacterium]MCB9918025.1 ABC transporter permease [Planctomycetota bacterium]